MIRTYVELALSRFRQTKVFFAAAVIAATGCGANSGALPAVAQANHAVKRSGSNTSIALAPSKTTLQGGVSQSDLIDLLERVGLKCAVHNDSGKLVIVDVHTGTDAFFQGVESGDEIKTCKKQGERVTLICERQGKPYQVILQALKTKLDSSSTTLSASANKNQADLLARNPRIGNVSVPAIPIVDVNQKGQPIMDVGPKPIPIADIELPKIPIVDVNQQKIPIVDTDKKVKKQPEEILKNYDVELIIDITGSMNDHDGTGDLTKFEWCREQVRSFVSKMSKYNHGINITLFNTEFETHYNCTPGKVDEIYAETVPSGRTDLVDPLMARLSALRGKKGINGPALIAVITDGLPNVPTDPLAVNRALVAYSQGLKDPNELLITFLQIGDTFDGRDFCVDLDDNLVNEGAKYDIIDTITFADLKKSGLAAAMVQSLEEKKAVRQTPLDKKIRHGLLAKPTAAQTQTAAQDDALLKERQDERRRFELELLGK